MPDSSLLDWVTNVGDKHGFSSGSGGGIEVGKGDDSVGIKRTPDGTTLTIKHEQDLACIRKTFAVGPIPCYTKAGLKASIAGSITVGNKTGGTLQATGAGSFEIGVGYSGSAFTAGPYGSVTLSASNSCSITHSDKDGLDVQPFTFQVKGSGKVGVKVELESGGKLDIDQEVMDWELFVVNVGRYANDKFEFIDVRAGKDMLRLIAALEAGGPQIEAFVEKYAPEAVKKAAIKGAEWTAESETAGDVAEVVEKGVKYIEDQTGVDVGAGAEEFVRALVDPGGETSTEATRRVNTEAKDYDARRDEMRALLQSSGLQGELREFRKTEEINDIIEKWRKETELGVKGKKSPEKWRQMVTDLVKTAKQRQAQKKAYIANQKRDEDERTKAALAMMEGARTSALGTGNVLNNKMKKTPNAQAKQFFDKGWKPWLAAENMRKTVGSLQGEDKANCASKTAALYAQAKKEFQTGLQYL